MEFPESSYLQSKSPLVLSNKIDHWEILNYKEKHWCDLFENKLLTFRQGYKVYKENPYWEQMCKSKVMTLGDFFKHSQEPSEDWLYFDYKYMKDVFPENTKLFDDIRWCDLQISDLSGYDSTIWIGNEGAHTPCHMDTYGCNVVAQILGRKLWILMPPEETDNLNPVRVPYEESSVYSSHNFYMPNDNLRRIKKGYRVILSPGDVLFVPRHWWHYVENLETAISINVWIPLVDDHESRLEECLVRHYVSNICKDLDAENAKKLLNPNEYELLTESNSFELLERCVEASLNVNKGFADNNPGKEVCKLEPLDISSYLSEKSQRYRYDPSKCEKISSESNRRVQLATKLINTYCHPKNISRLKNCLLSCEKCVSTST